MEPQQLMAFGLPLLLFFVAGLFAWDCRNGGTRSDFAFSMSFFAAALCFSTFVFAATIPEPLIAIIVTITCISSFASAIYGLAVRSRIGKLPVVGFAATMIAIFSVCLLANGLVLKAVIVGGEIGSMVFYASGAAICLHGRGFASRLCAAIFALGTVIYCFRLVELYHGIMFADSALTFASSSYFATLQLISFVVVGAAAFGLIIASLEDRMERQRDRDLHDQLSGLPVRAYFFDQCEALMRRNANSPWTFLILDLDHFKSINDTYGHAIGDRVIAAAGRIIADRMTGFSFAGRIGGEEFAILIHGPVAVAKLAAEGIRTAFEAQEWGQDLTVTASFGLAEVVEVDIDAAMRRADAALYTAKANGRNCVVADADARPDVQAHSVAA